MTLTLLLNTRMMWRMFIKNIEEFIPNKKRKILFVFDYMIADMLSNKELNPIITKLFIRSRKLNIYLLFIKKFILLRQKILD